VTAQESETSSAAETAEHAQAHAAKAA
jgi:hypothetical protein